MGCQVVDAKGLDWRIRGAGLERFSIETITYNSDYRLENVYGKSYSQIGALPRLARALSPEDTAIVI